MSLHETVDALLKLYGTKGAEPDAIWSAVRNALSATKLVDNLAEAFRVPPDQIRHSLEELGFSDLLLRDVPVGERPGAEAAGGEPGLAVSDQSLPDPFPEIFSVKLTPPAQQPVPAASDLRQLLDSTFRSVTASAADAPFAKLYRHDVMGYFNDFMRQVAPEIGRYVRESFAGLPAYLVTTGIGANELFCHFPATINNSDVNRRLVWIIADSPKQLMARLPHDATVRNTLFMEFSRSGVTEEIVKIHEYTPRELRRIVFSNTGPLRDLAQRDGNLLLTLPDQVSGRFGRNKTPILLAPMYVAGMDVEAYWRDIDRAVTCFDVSSPASLPVILAKFLLLHQRTADRNLIYLGCNDDSLSLIGDDLLQFWNEGVNKGGNDFLIMKGFGLPRDSHTILEGVLGNHRNKMAVFLLRSDMRPPVLPPLVSRTIDPIDPRHSGLQFGDEEAILAIANYLRCRELMPTVLVEIRGEACLRHAAIIGQLFADTTYVYSRLIGVDPGSNPEVKAVREGSARLLTQAADGIRAGLAAGDALR